MEVETFSATNGAYVVTPGVLVATPTCDYVVASGATSDTQHTNDIDIIKVDFKNTYDFATAGKVEISTADGAKIEKVVGCYRITAGPASTPPMSCTVSSDKAILQGWSSLTANT